MEGQVLRAFCALVVATACGCGLAKGGLLVAPDTGDAAAAGDGAQDDATTPDDEAASGDDGQPLDAFVERDGAADGARDGRADANPDARVDARSDATLDAPHDAPLDALSDGPADGPLDGPADGPAQPTDAPPDAPRPAIVWDGGAIADPQFGESAWVDFCATLVGCGHLPSMSACTALLAQPSSPDALIPPTDLVTAVNIASPDCMAVDEALGDGSGCLSANPDICSGNAMVTCRWGFTMTVDCGALGLVCSNGVGNAGCGFGDCSPAEEGQTFCVGPDYVARCVSGRYTPDLDCHTFGGTCTGPNGAAQCRGTGATMCTAGTSCVGDSIAACLDGLLGGVGCSQVYDPSFTCITGDAGAPVCAAGISCDPASFQDTCARAGAVSFCNAGVPALYDCIGNGWSDCAGGQCVP